jgi:hypothetical protein
MLNKAPRPSIFLKNVGKNLFLNFITIEDEDFFSEQFPGNTLQQKMAEGDVDSVLAIFWRLLDNDGKRLIRDAKLIRWEGMKEVVVTTEDPVEKLRMIISGADEITAIMEAIFGVRVKSSPEPKLNEKKKLKADDL